MKHGKKKRIELNSYYANVNKSARVCKCSLSRPRESWTLKSDDANYRLKRPQQSAVGLTMITRVVRCDNDRENTFREEIELYAEDY